MMIQEWRKTCRDRITSNDYADYIVSYYENRGQVETYFRNECLRFIDNNLAIVTIDRTDIDMMSVIATLYYMVPKCYGLMDTGSIEESGIYKVQNQPVLNLRGRNVLVGIIDTGIDYQNPLFRWADGSTRIEAIWDQTIQAEIPPEGLLYGSVYSKAQINEALQTENPLELVPSQDTNGHGTFAAGIIAGGEDPGNDFTGAAPMADLLVVKLKQAKQYLKDFYFLNGDEVYQETDIIQAVSYLVSEAARLEKPLSIYIGVGTASGDHAGQGSLNQLLNRINLAPNFIVSVPAGNEGSAGHHFSGVVTDDKTYQEVELNVGADEPGFVMELWGEVPGTYAIGIESPYGEVVERILPLFNRRQRIDFILERTLVEVAYVLAEELSGKPLIFIRMVTPREGIWRFRVFASGNSRNEFHIWLPIRKFLSENTFFLRPDPFITLSDLGTGEGSITATAYNHTTGALYLESSRGYTDDGRVKPDLAAPGVNVYGPAVRERQDSPYGYTRKSGSSIAAAHAAGAAALLMEWSGRLRLSGTQIRRYLLRGAGRNPEQEYPNPSWGYGTLDLYGTFERLTQNRS